MKRPISVLAVATTLAYVVIVGKSLPWLAILLAAAVFTTIGTAARELARYRKSRPLTERELRARLSLPSPGI